MSSIKSRLDAIASNRAKQFARKVDAIRVGAKVEPANVRVDITAPTVITDDDGNALVERKPLHACGATVVREGKALGTIATPSSYTKWIKAGCPAHPIYNPEAWKATRYVNGVALPSGGSVSDDRYIGKGRFIESTANVRHERNCTCPICAEYHRSMAQRHIPVDPRIDPVTLPVTDIMAHAAKRAPVTNGRPLVPPVRIVPRGV